MKEHTSEQEFSIFKFIPLRLAPWILALFACLIYANTFPNQYALDDTLVLYDNHYVNQGLAGIPTILTTDMFDSYFKDMGVEQVLSGGRYRPLAQVTFAIENQFFGLNPMVSHIINVLLFGLLVAIMFSVLLRAFKMNADVVLIATLLFAVHPVHTEVVANIKSRDEIFSLLFILLGFQYAFRYVDTGKKLNLLWMGIVLFLAFLSKEYSYGLIVLLPLAITIFRNPYPKGRLTPTILVFLGVAVVYSMMRYSFVGFEVIEQDDVLNNPYLHATPDEALATKIFVLSKYILLLLFPHPLTSDYSYPQIAYLSFSSPLVWLSFITYAAITIAGFYLAYKKHFLGFAIMLYLMFFFPVSNLLLDIGATMGERLIFHASLGFCLVAAYFLEQLYRKYSLNKAVIIAPLLMIALAASAKTITRNMDWYDTDSLFLRDVQTVPLSVIANNNAADAVIKKADHEKDPVKKKQLIARGKAYALQALKPYPEFVNALINLGLTEHLENNNDSAMKHWLLAKKYLPQSPHFNRLAEHFYNRGMNEGLKNPRQAIYFFKMSTQLNEAKSEPWSNMGGAYYTLQKYDSAYFCWQTALKINPNDAEALRGSQALRPQPAVK